MRFWLRHCYSLVVLVSALGLALLPAAAGTMVAGTGNGLFTLDPLTGDLAPLIMLPGWLGWVTSSAPAYNSILIYSPVNIYQVDVMTREFTLYACPADLCAFVGDLAYDSSDGVVYGVGILGANGPPTLFRLHDSGTEYPGIPGSHWIDFSPFGELGAGISAMEFVPGLGLYGIDNGLQAGYLIDEKTGHASFLAPLSEPIFPDAKVGLAYDSETGRLLASIGTRFPYTPERPGAIFWLDPRNGLMTPLSVDTPDLHGIAEARTPEPGPASTLLPGLIVGLVVRRFQRRRHRFTCRAGCQWL